MTSGPKGPSGRSEGVMCATIPVDHPQGTPSIHPTERAIVMWPPLERTRRRLLGDAGIPADGRGDPPSSVTPAVPADPMPAVPAPADDVVLTIGRTELDRLGAALQAFLGPDTARPDTPDRLESALATAVERLGGDGRPRVTRRPPGVYTPEAWQVRLSKVDPAIGEAIRGAARGLGFSA